MKMNLLMFFLFSFVFLDTFSQNFSIKAIESFNLSRESILFEKTLQSFDQNDQSAVIFKSILQDAFLAEERYYLSNRPNNLFFHAVLDNRVIGYVSCELLDGYRVHIRQLIVDPDFFQTEVVKELLIVAFRNCLQVHSLTVACFSFLPEMIDSLKNFGFNQIEHELTPSLDYYNTYEIRMNFKCKICDLLYPNIWTDELYEDIENKEIEEEA